MPHGEELKNLWNYPLLGLCTIFIPQYFLLYMYLSLFENMLKSLPVEELKYIVTNAHKVSIKQMFCKFLKYKSNGFKNLKPKSV